jgi:hypothetical protein
MTGKSAKKITVHNVPEPASPGNSEPGSPATTILADKYAMIPPGAANVLLMVTPVVEWNPFWPYFAASILASGLVIPIFLHEPHRTERFDRAETP